ncbi:MAG: hypothetical protein K6F69_00675 [Treponema sp.]|nr:hypothetical protein [Treponema sp.]
MKKVRFSLLFAMVASIAFFSCGSNDKTESKKNANTTELSNASLQEGGELVFGSATELNNFNPFDSITADVRGINFNIFEGLVKVSTDGTFKPAIAESYTISDDATTYTFKIRKNVIFHNGKTLDKNDVLYSIQKAKDSGFAGYKEIKDFTFTDDDTLVITLNAANASFIPYLSNAIVPADSTNLELSPIGTGPFKFSEYAEQNYIKLTKNNEYWGEKAHLDSVTVKFIASQADLVMSFQSGSIDGFSAEAGTVMQLDEKTLNKYQSNSNAVQLLALNNAVKPFDDERVRQALCYAINRKEIIDSVNYGYGIQLGSGLIPALTKYYDDSLASTYETDIEKAKELLAQAGYTNGFKFSITVPSVYTVHVDTAAVIVNQLAKIGVTAEIKLVDWATWLSGVYKGRQYDATIISLDGPLAYPTAFLSRYTSTAGNNFVNFKSSSYDEAYNKAISTINEDEKVQFFKEAQKILNKEAASAFIQDISEFTVYNKKFEGYAGYPLYARDFSAVHMVK